MKSCKKSCNKVRVAIWKRCSLGNIVGWRETIAARRLVVVQASRMVGGEGKRTKRSGRIPGIFRESDKQDMMNGCEKSK